LPSTKSNAFKHPNKSRALFGLIFLGCSPFVVTCCDKQALHFLIKSTKGESPRVLEGGSPHDEGISSPYQRLTGWLVWSSLVLRRSVAAHSFAELLVIHTWQWKSVGWKHYWKHCSWIFEPAMLDYRLDPVHRERQCGQRSALSPEDLTIWSPDGIEILGTTGEMLDVSFWLVALFDHVWSFWDNWTCLLINQIYIYLHTLFCGRVSMGIISKCGHVHGMCDPVPPLFGMPKYWSDVFIEHPLGSGPYRIPINCCGRNSLLMDF
jgi:hypothetical protein